MSGRLRAEIKQRRPFKSLAEEAYLNLLRTAEVLAHRVTETLKPFGVTPTQYNLLRILRGAGSEGAACSAVGERMVTRDPDITRLMDRLEKRGLIARSRDGDDRRVVRTRITRAGLDLLQRLDEPIVAAHDRHLGHLGKGRLAALVEALEDVRQELP